MRRTLRSLRRRLVGAPPPVVPAVRLSGTIAEGQGGLGPKRLNLAGVAKALDRAFADADAPAVALIVNSPGGSAVQSHLIHRRIRLLAERHEKPVLAFVEDVAASGGYMIACAADEIVADPASIVGSIGVVSKSFGLTGLIERLGVERRTYTAGESKDFLDPFRPERAADVAHLRALQEEIHGQFIALVKARRGDRLADDDSLFTGLFWAGEKARALGLVDAFGEVRATVKERYGTRAEVRLVEPARAPLWRRLGAGMAGGAAEGALAALEDRAIRARFGL